MQPKVGDTVILEVTVVSTEHEIFRYNTLNGIPSSPVNMCWITKVIPRAIQVGNTVRVKNDILPDFHYKVLALHGSDIPLTIPYGPTRRWAVVAHGDDVPNVYNVSKLECVD